MNFGAVLPLLFAVSVFAISAFTASNDARIFANSHAAFVVLGGTFSAAAISFGFMRLFVLSKVIANRVLFGRKSFTPVALIEEMMRLSEAYRLGSPQLASLIERSQDPFLKEAMTALTEQILSPEELLRALSTRTESVYGRYQEEAVKFKALAKFPPAFGLMGAVMGMVGIMNELGSKEGAAGIGPSLALALLGTLYGVALANLIILPISESLMDSAREVRLKYSIITEGVALISQKKHPIVLAEELNSFLLASERIDWKKAAQGFEKIGA
jgi:chemotaxis protein MotA